MHFQMMYIFFNLFLNFWLKCHKTSANMLKKFWILPVKKSSSRKLCNKLIWHSLKSVSCCIFRCQSFSSLSLFLCHSFYFIDFSFIFSNKILMYLVHSFLLLSSFYILIFYFETKFLQAVWIKHWFSTNFIAIKKNFDAAKICQLVCRLYA